MKPSSCAVGTTYTFAGCLLALLAGLLVPAELDAQPAMEPDAATMRLDELGLYAVGYAYRGQAERQLPLGWSGFDDTTGVTCVPAGFQGGRAALLLHCPWRGGTGLAFQQFAFRLPVGPRILLRGATALNSDTYAKSDGATFRVFANGVKLLETHRTSDAWQDFEFDLTALAGGTATVRFETDPGPRNDSSYDHSLWGERELVLEGYTPPPRVYPEPRQLDISRLHSAESGSVVPPSGFEGATTAELSGDVAHFRYTGPDGSLEYRWERPTAAADPLFGRLTLTAQMTGQASVTVPLAGSAALLWTQTATPASSFWQSAPGGVLLVRSFQVGATSAAVRITGSIEGKSLALRVTCESPLVRSLDAGVWGPVFRRRQIAAPYYTGRAYFLPAENVFASAYLDWTASAASSHDGTVAYYGALTDGSRNLLRERVIFSAAWHLAEVLPNIPNPPSPYRGFLAERVVLDVWGGSFRAVADNLARLADYGLTSCVALIHVWQRSGYDNALPMHVPANVDLGGESAMKDLVAAGRRLGIPVALHENYVDYYPNYDLFDEDDIALDSSGSRVLAWFNPGTEIQSFAVKPNAILRLAATQSPEIHARYGTEADYLDVHSAVPPWFHVDFRAGESGAGTFRRVWDVHRELWDYERATHQGPVFGEGANHWYWSGCLDGVEAQFPYDSSGGASANGGMDAPLAVDFDLLKIHPLQLNHGMGYYERWWSKDFGARLAGPPPLVVLDQYRMQQVAFGHAGFLAHSTYSQIPLAWLEHHLLSPVASRYAMARPTEILHEVGGKWIDASAQVRATQGSTGGASRSDRVRVRYEGGLVVTANGRDDPLQVGSWLLPQFGWLAEGAGVTAGTVIRDGVVADFAQESDSFFASARSAADWYLSSFRSVRPTVASFQQTAARTFRATYRWEVADRLPKDYRCFVHFTVEGDIRWQQDHALTPKTLQWQPGTAITDGPYSIAVPAQIPDGDYDWLIGLFDVATGERVRLLGVDDGTSRIRLGAVRLRDGGASVTFERETGTGEDPSPLYREHLNLDGRIVDFGALRTDGSVRLLKVGEEWAARTWPRERSFTLELAAERFGRPSRVRCVSGPVAELTPVDAGSRWRLPLNGSVEYRWAAGASPSAFRRGEVNGDGTVDLSDAVAVLGWLFLGAAKPVCTDAADSNDDAKIDLSDGVFILNWLFSGGPAPPAPGPHDCGPDSTPDGLADCAYPQAECGP